MNIYISVCICMYTYISVLLMFLLLYIAFILIVTIFVVVVTMYCIMYHIYISNSLERTSALLVCIHTKFVKSQGLQALSASMKAAFFPRIPVPWPSESCSTCMVINRWYVKVHRKQIVQLQAACHTCHSAPSLASPLKRRWKTARHDPALLQNQNTSK